ncbi:E2 ubiquitin-conjugating enzyme [Malassezia vespertilionis]|uniref:UBC core domain-containing protein n=1 Tax=Malassezia vespertilionis TaxID=2020962 RepID=A0A2N1JF80_9BASI|nr:E2 ubiquitin-conjugating enzyme [Malassezia vespertilionis]PKI85213.1 hypothetical protein MVES_001206 [Malassezia vespertilionis]WFD05947.1 E2 ubiquitin-conjugating enzyme [Malassezia vespertilionis]
MAAPSTSKRLLHELTALHKRRADADDLVAYLAPATEDNLMVWEAELHAPRDGVYSGGRFRIAIQVPAAYPTKPPVMRFKTPIFHPNVHWKTGEICLDVLQSQWSPAWTLHSACTAVLALLDVPEPDSPLNVDAANLFRHDAVAYRGLCGMYANVYAMSGTT